jgi:hypothetical protein
MIWFILISEWIGYWILWCICRQQFILEMCSLFTWRSHLGSSTRVGCTCL